MNSKPQPKKSAPPSAEQQRIASFGRRRGRRLRTGKQALFDTLLPQLSIDLPEGGLELGTLFPAQESYWLEVGFGGGEHLAHQAELYSRAGIIGCEPYVNGIAGLLKHIDDHKLNNIRIYSDDARKLMAKLPDKSLEKAFVLYPDPWPKSRHHKRRLISKEFLDEVGRILKPGGILQLATDHADYCSWMLERLLSHGKFTWDAKTCDDRLNPPKDWISTKYEQKALAGRPTYLRFIVNNMTDDPKTMKWPKHAIFTLGHSTLPIEKFIALLQTYGIGQLVDIRTIPKSRHNPQFNTDTLEDSLKKAHIRYMHMKDLGGLRHARKDSPNMGWRNTSFRGYADYMQTEEFHAALDELIALSRKQRTAIMCAESVPWRCHRSLVADALSVRKVPVIEVLSEKNWREHKMIPFAETKGTEILYPPEQAQLL